MTTPTQHPDYQSPSGYPYSPPPEPKRRPWVARHKVLTGLLAVAALFFVGGIAGVVSGGSNAPKVALSPSVSVPTPPPLPKEQRDANASASNARTSVPVTPEKKPAPPRVLTPGQQNAIGSAKDYLDLSGFSRKALIQQLSSPDGEGYSKADATFAVDYLHVNWKAQAVRSAKDYLALQHFSRSGLIQQLSSQYGDGYTRAEATYAADQVGL